jgi:hypothetical protein
MNKEPAYLTGKGGIHAAIEKEEFHIVLHNVVLVEKKNMTLVGRSGSEVFMTHGRQRWSGEALKKQVQCKKVI